MQYSSLPQSDSEVGNEHQDPLPASRLSSEEYPPTRRISASFQSYWHRHGYAANGSGSTSTGASLGGKTGSGSSRMLLKPRALALCFGAFLIIILTVHDDSRSAAHSALTSVGIPLPNAMPDIGLSDNVKAGLHKWSGGIVGAGRESWDGGFDGEEGGLGGAIEWQNTTIPKDPSAILDAAEPFVNKMIYHPTNGYLLLPDPSKPNAVKAIMEEQHPILELIANAEKKWDALVARQSKTLPEAVAEYKRRYARNPPKGFDKWWDYATKNNIVLKDEYDQIHRDMQVFWALEPHDLLHRSRVMATERAETFTLMINPAREEEQKITTHGEEAHLKRATDLAALIEPYAKVLPGVVNMTFTKHDQPACALGFQHKERLHELAAEGDFFTSSDFIRPENPNLSNWANGCPPSSPLYLAELGELNEAHPSHPTKLDIQRSFIYNHNHAMDICQHPESMHLHGFTSAPGTNLANLVPLFTFAKTNLHSDVLATPLEQYSDTYIGYDPVWAEKTINKLLWRGSTTGAEFAKGVEWKLSQRARLHFMGHEKEGKKHVLWADKKESKMRVNDFDTAALNDEYMDVAFSGHPVQCDDETCKVMEKIIDFAPTMGLDESYQYKYLMDVDGNGWSGRFHRLMSTKSVVLKSTIFPEWYSERVMPWVHYVPIKVDYSDLYDVMTFFVGTPDGKGSHDDIAAKLAAQGKEWARTHWRREDMASYMFRLLLEWTRVMHRVDEEDWDFILPK